MRKFKLGCTKKSRHLALGLLLFSVAPWVHSNAPSHQIAEFCESCTTAAAAQQRAWFHAPAVHCDWPGGGAEFPSPPDVSCWSTDREVILINPYTHAIYSYRLVFNPASNSHVLEEWALTPDLSGAASVIHDIHHSLIGFEFSQHVQGHEVRKLPGYDLTGEGECPQGTALDHVLNPGMRQWMIDQMHSNWMEVMQAFQQREPGVSRTIGISASFGAVRLTVGWGSGGAPIDQVFRAGFVFNESEVGRSPPHQDMLVFDVDEFFQLGTNVSMNIEFNEGLSRAAGQPVNILFSGQVQIDNPCVLQKLDEYQQYRPDVG